MLSEIPGLMDQVRARFAHVESCPLTGPRVFFENAGGALTLNSVVETSAKFAAIPDNQGRNNPASKQLSDIIEKAKDDTKVFFGTATGQVFVGESGTELLFRLVRAAATLDTKGEILAVRSNTPRRVRPVRIGPPSQV